ncbi:agmatinase [Oceanicoccus sagamiensis]|uniref:Agmatinase n=1 Tax=Oceanicoccus sagamiensis TaxID=716816 RepID=A0A1X9NFK3_9GAMM|nr:agmatinase [Oceanicoccus sagamiensis]ARN75961.1 agmatinase [Oceanicoccus sagamiensis]
MSTQSGDDYPNTYGNIFSFMDFPLSKTLADDIDAVVMGIPYDLATTGRSGTRFGPNAIRQASAQLRWEQRRWPWHFTLADRLKVIDYGDIIYEDGNSQDLTAMVTEQAGAIFAANKTLLSFGGDHFVTLPLLRACSAHYGKLALIHFDAHTDDEAREDIVNHGSMFYHAPREGLIDSEKTIQVGIRTEYNYDTHPFTVLDGVQANNLSVEDIITAIKETVGEGPVYLSFDIDCLDPAYAPGTGTPVAGGISSSKALQIIRGLSDINIVAMDVVEVAPAYDRSEITALAGATLALEMLYLLGSKKT